MDALGALETMGGFQQAEPPGAVDLSTFLGVGQFDERFTDIHHPLGYWRPRAGQITPLRGVALAEFNTELATQCATFSWPRERHWHLLQEIRNSRKSSFADGCYMMRRPVIRSNDSDAIVCAARPRGHQWRKTHVVCEILASALGFKAKPNITYKRFL